MSRHLLLAATVAACALSGAASAQSVRMFEEPPPLELLRSIMVPASQPGLSRRIVLGSPDRPAEAAAPIAAPMAAPVAEAAERDPAPAPAPRARRPAPAAVVASARMPLPLPAPTPAESAASAASSVGFRINFALDSDVVPQSAYPFVDRIAEVLRDQPQLRLQVEGHTDALGSDTYNLQLSARRAAAVATYLVKRQGVDPARLVILGLGETAPLTEDGFDPRNRRVQFTPAE